MSFFGSPSLFQQAASFWVDAAQRTVLLADVLRRRGAQYGEHNAAGNPPVLGFDYELVLDGASLERPTSYQLLRILPGDRPTDPSLRPYVVIDPRAGQGPGIGGSQMSSQVGVALRAGHPVYFVSFRPEPEPGQTIGAITAAELAFVRWVREAHPGVGEPVLIGNCQAGWAVALLACRHREDVGPVVLAGAPLTFWDGPEEGGSPLRYLGGLFGGSWMGALASDLGHGRFDGAYLVQNFETLNPAHSMFRKLWRVYEEVDTEAERFLEFERWWGGFFQMNAEELRFISNELFVQNKLARGELRLEGQRLDLRHVRGPIVVLASDGDTITPPAQALNWVLDLYESVDDIRTAEQTIVYCVHPDVGHLGIFVSGRLAEREHAEVIENLDLIELLPPGLYELVITEIPEDDRTCPYVEGRYASKLVARTLTDLRRIGGRSEANDARFAAVARLSEANRQAYETMVSPVVKSLVSEESAEALRQLQPARLRYWLWSEDNPWFRPWAPWVEKAADAVREQRRPLAEDNVFWQWQQRWAEGLVGGLQALTKTRNQTVQTWFETVYGAPWWQREEAPDAPPREEVFAHLDRRRGRHLDALMTEGGFVAGLLRAGIFVLMASHGVDEHAYNAFRICVLTLPEAAALAPEALRRLIHDQTELLLARPQEAVAALVDLIDEEDRARCLAIVEEIAGAGGREDTRRQGRIVELRSLLLAD